MFGCLAVRMAMHACQIGPTDTAPPCPGSPHRAYLVARGETLKPVVWTLTEILTKQLN